MAETYCCFINILTITASFFIYLTKRSQLYTVYYVGLSRGMSVREELVWT
jgi:maltodextrin utilization protein YvdJ